MRQTGRTTRMLERALASALQMEPGKRVLVVAHSPRYARDLQRRFREVAGERGVVARPLENRPGLVLENGAEVQFQGPDPYQLRGTRDPVYVDHWVWDGPELPLRVYEELREVIRGRMER